MIGRGLGEKLYRVGSVFWILWIGKILAPVTLAAVLTESVPFTSGKEGYACYRTPALVVSQKGTVLAFCGGRVNDHRDEGDIDIVLKRSTDGGRT